MMEVYFTTKVASHEAFCNRVAERELIARNIEKNQHMVIVAPRRYGKTSLAMQALSECGHPFSRADLFCVVYEEDICRKVAAAISELIRSIASFSEKTVQILEQCFRSASITFKAGKIELGLDFRKDQADPVHKLEDLLAGLEMLAAKHKKKLVLFFDEFQDVLRADKSNQIQAAVRAVAQHSKYVTYIFSGSSRKMLSRIFEDRNQPLYMLCQKIMLDRIAHADFVKHIQYAAQKKWETTLSYSLLTDIFCYTQYHPYYVNLLCDKLWDAPTPPTGQSIIECWEQCLFEHRGKIISDLESLNTNRMKVLTIIALLGVVNEPNSKTFLDKVKLPLTSTQNAVKYLLDQDFLHETDDGLAVMDPLIQLFIRRRHG